MGTIWYAKCIRKELREFENFGWRQRIEYEWTMTWERPKRGEVLKRNAKLRGKSIDITTRLM